MVKFVVLHRSVFCHETGEDMLVCSGRQSPQLAWEGSLRHYRPLETVPEHPGDTLLAEW